MPTTTTVYLCPGMFGFGQLASFNYFEHIEAAITERFAARSRACRVVVCHAHPTASIRRRAVRLAKTIHEHSGGGSDLIHIVGHSTGGLDARMVASPAVNLPGVASNEMSWRSRLRSITSMNTPHFGTPLAAFFATKSGQQVLYAVTALTVTVLKLGSPPLAAASALAAAFGRVSGAIELEILERTSESIIKVLDDASSRDLRSFLRLIHEDQGALIQLTPESMDLFQAVEDRPGLRYQCVAGYAPRGGLRSFITRFSSPWNAVSAAVFSTLYNITARLDPRYPCHAVDNAAGRDAMRTLLGELPAETENDGVVPLYSQLWGDLVWVGKGDHLDVVGHFPGRGKRKELQHVDWLRSGAGFDETRFDTLMDRVVAGMLLGEDSTP